MTDTGVKEERYQDWGKQLLDRWEFFNDVYLSEGLKSPIFQIGQSTQILGYWDPTSRTLTISAIHIERDPWEAVMDTLRHEMAHQFVTEVLKAVDEKPHGPAFQKACERLRCDPRPRYTEDGSANDAEEPTSLRQLKKLLSLSESPNEHEAQAAVQKARYILAKYNIDSVELGRERSFRKRILGDVKGRRMPVDTWLGSILKSFFFVETIWIQSYDALQDRSGRVLQIWGTPENLAMAEHVYYYLRSLLEPLWDEYKTSHRLRSNWERQLFFAGLMKGFYQKLKEQTQVLEKTHALIWKGDPELRAFHRYHYPYVRKLYGGRVSQTQTYKDGIEGGKKIEVRKPIDSSESILGGYITQ